MNPQDPLNPPAGSQIPKLEPDIHSSATQPSATGESQVPNVAASSQLGPQPLSAQSYQPTRQEYAADYLDQIAPVEQKAANRMGVIGLISGALCLVSLVAFVINSLQPPSLASTILPLQARIETLQAVTEEQNGRLNESAISNANSSLNAVLITMSSDISKITTEKKIKKSNDKKVKAAEANYRSSLANGLALDSARGLLDRTYTAKMTYELNILKTMFKKVLGSTKQEKIEEFVNAAIKNIDATL